MRLFQYNHLRLAQYNSQKNTSHILAEIISAENLLPGLGHKHTLKPRSNGVVSQRKLGNVNFRTQTCGGWAKGLARRCKFNSSNREFEPKSHIIGPQILIFLVECSPEKDCL